MGGYRKIKYTNRVNKVPGKRELLRKVPEIALIFWIAKLLTTAMGESTSDYLVNRINPYLAVSIGAMLLLVALIIQFRAKSYVPWIYWFCVAMVAVFGTMAADALHKQLGIPYLATTILFSVSLAVIFSLWYKTEKTLSIHSINNPRRELFYWATVMATFALGTAAGDLAAFTLNLGFFTSALLFTSLMLIPAAGYFYFGLNEVAAFWTAYIITRPVGASFADWLGKSKSVGGLGLGSGLVAIVLSALIIILVVQMSRTSEKPAPRRLNLS
ncbi:MAG TPA: hypothetical protein VIH90_03420 [Candidatus Saccharimonadales bacterium]